MIFNDDTDAWKCNYEVKGMMCENGPCTGICYDPDMTSGLVPGKNPVCFWILGVPDATAVSSCFRHFSVPLGRRCTWRGARVPQGAFVVRGLWPGWWTDVSFVDAWLWAAPSTCSATVLHHHDLLKIFGLWFVLRFLPGSGLLQLGSQVR